MESPSERARITVSHNSGLDFSVECTRSDEPFATQTKELIIKKSSTSPFVSFKAATIRSSDSSVTGSFSAQLDGSSKMIKPKQRRIVTVSFAPLREGYFEAALELTFCDHARNADFIVQRTLNGLATRPTGGQAHYQNGSAHVVRPQPVYRWGDDHASASSDEEEEFLDSDDTGISVSNEEGLNVGFVERRRPNGPFTTATSSLTINLAPHFPAVTFLKERIKTVDGSDSCFVATFDGNSRIIRPGTENVVCIIFSPKFDGLFKATLNLVFYDTERSVRFVIRRSLQGIAGSVKDHKHFEALDQEDSKKPAKNHKYEAPSRVELLSHSNRRRKSRQLPDYEIPIIVQEAVDRSTLVRPFDQEAPRLVASLRPKKLSIDTYAQYFKALLQVEDGHLQWEIRNQPFYVVGVKKHAACYSIEIENNDEDLLPEVIVGDFLWLDDLQEDIRYEARITRAEVFTRGQSRIAVLKMSLRLPTCFNLYTGAQFILRFRLNRVTLRRQYHALATASTRRRRLLFPSEADIKPIQRLSRAEINALQLANENIRNDDQQLQTVVSVLGQPKGSVPFIIFGPPGTGKTTTVVEVIIQLVRRDARVKILACTPSNAAADLLVERLAAAGLDPDKLYRLNAYSREEEEVPDGVQSFSQTPNHEKLMAFRVVLSTCSSASMLQTLNIPVGHFSHIVIDEAAQAEEPLAMIPIMGLSDAYTNVILAGDPKQLGPVIKSATAGKTGLGKSYLDRLMLMREVYGIDTQATKTIVRLQRNRRSHGAIIAWPNRYFYEDSMRAYGHPDIMDFLTQSDVLPKKGFPVIFHGIRGNERRTKWSPSYFNIFEASVVRDYCVKLIEDPQRRIYPEEIGIIAPYRAQVRAIRDLLKGQERLRDISVGSVEQFQGQERKVIIMATTRSNEQYHLRKAMGFLTNPRRLNVAITRAQSLLILVGDPEVLGKDPLWRTFLNYIRLRKGSTGKEPSWKANETNLVPAQETIRRREGVVYGEEFIDKKSECIYRYDLSED